MADALRPWLREAGTTLQEMRATIGAAARRDGGRSMLFEWEKGAVSEAEFVAVLQPEFGANVPLAELRRSLYANLRRNERMIDYLAALHDRGVRLALLTNNIREAERDWHALLPEREELFEVVVDSSLVGMRKPDPRIYELTLARLGGVEPSDCVLLDDNVPNVEAARELGMGAVHYVDDDQAIAALEQVCARGGAG